MAKASSKAASPKAPTKKVPAGAKPKAVIVDIEKASQDALDKLRSLNIEHTLQADIDWCLGSYRSDRNPIGLYDMVSRSIVVFKAELKNKTKGVTVKLIADLEKALASK